MNTAYRFVLGDYTRRSITLGDLSLSEHSQCRCVLGLGGLHSEVQTHGSFEPSEHSLHVDVCWGIMEWTSGFTLASCPVRLTNTATGQYILCVNPSESVIQVIASYPVNMEMSAQH